MNLKVRTARTGNILVDDLYGRVAVVHGVTGRLMYPRGDRRVLNRIAGQVNMRLPMGSRAHI